MRRTDDMTMRVRAGAALKPSAPVRARERRALDAGLHDKRRGLLGKLTRIRAARNLARRRRVRAARKKTKMSGGLKAGLIAAATGVAMGALRLLSGQPFESTGADINRLFLGDLDEEARARMQVRQRLTSDRELTRIVGRQGEVNEQIASVAKDLSAVALRREKGATAIREELGVDNIADRLILRVDSAARRLWSSSDGPAAMERAKRALAERRGTNGGRGR